MAFLRGIQQQMLAAQTTSKCSIRAGAVVLRPAAVLVASRQGRGLVPGADPCRVLKHPLTAGVRRAFGQAGSAQPAAQTAPASARTRNNRDTVALDGAGAQWGSLHPLLIRAVLALGFWQPTEVQRLALSKAVAPSWQDLLLLAETGSGKTLAYLLPTLHRVKELEAKTGVRARPRRPRALVIVPTRELGEQVLKEAKALAHVSKFRSAGAFGGGRRSDQADALVHGCDLLIATPMRLVSLAEDGLVYFGDVRAVAVDEADTILTQGFRKELELILMPVRAAAAQAARLHKEWLDQLRTGTLSREAMLHSATWKDSPFHVDDPGRLQMTLVAATASSAVSNLVRKILPEALMLRTSGVHRVPPGVKQRFFDVSEMGQRDALIVNVRECLKWIAKTLQRSGKGEQEKVGGSIMIFCNTKASCSFVHEQLKAEGIRHASIHGDLSKDERFVQMNMFAEGQVPVLVATDLASRGMHLQTVRAVINFDMPLNVVDYIHRLGRTGRASTSGLAISLVRKRDGVLVRNIQAALTAGDSLEGVRGVGSKSPTRGVSPLRFHTVGPTGAGVPAGSSHLSRRRGGVDDGMRGGSAFRDGGRGRRERNPSRPLRAAIAGGSKDAGGAGGGTGVRRNGTSISWGNKLTAVSKAGQRLDNGFGATKRFWFVKGRNGKTRAMPRRVPKSALKHAGGKAGRRLSRMEAGGLVEERARGRNGGRRR